MILVVPHEAVADATKAIGPLADGKVLLEVTNTVTDDFGLAMGFSTSAAEEVQKM